MEGGTMDVSWQHLFERDETELADLLLCCVDVQKAVFGLDFASVLGKLEFQRVLDTSSLFDPCTAQSTVEE